MWKLYLLLGIFGCWILYKVSTRPDGAPANQVPNPGEEPLQEEISDQETSPIRRRTGDYNWTITPKAAYRIGARVLRAERYHMGWKSDLSPVDLALGWGEIANEKVDDWISWNQSGRWYFYRLKSGSPYSTSEIVSQSANVHILPATENLKAVALRISRNDRVLLEGNLVNVDGNRGSATYFWHTSLTRTDMGNGSCELLYVKNLVWNGKEYR